MALSNKFDDKNETEGKDSTETDPLRENPTDQVPEIDEKYEDKTFCGKCQYVLKNITLEPTMILFVLAAVLNMNTTQNLSLEKACRVNLNFTDEICKSLRQQSVESQNEYERESQLLLASALRWRTYITATIPSLAGIFTGAWSDKTGRRKIFLIIPITGQILACISNIVNSFFFYELRLEYLVLSEALFEALSGGWCVTFTTIFIYISTITTHENRTFRLGLINFCLTVGFPIGMGLSGILLKNFGFIGCYVIAGCLQFINLLYNTIIVKDPERTVAQKKHDGRGFRHFCRTFFDLSNVKATISVVFKNDANKRRLRMCVLLAVVTVLFGPMFGEMSVMYMSTRYRFNWDEVRFSIFQTYNFITHTIGTIFSITVFSRYLKWHDSMLGIISTVSKIAASFVYCFAPNERIFFIAPLVEILNGTSLLAIRSITSKLVESNELGKVNSIFGLTENLMPLVYVPLYTNVYTATMEVLPGAVFLLGATMTFPALVVFIWLFVEHRRKGSKIPVENGQEVASKP